MVENRDTSADARTGADAGTAGLPHSLEAGQPNIGSGRRRQPGTCRMKDNQIRCPTWNPTSTTPSVPIYYPTIATLRPDSSAASSCAPVLEFHQQGEDGPTEWKIPEVISPPHIELHNMLGHLESPVPQAQPFLQSARTRAVVQSVQSEIMAALQPGPCSTSLSDEDWLQRGHRPMAASENPSRCKR